MKLTLSVLNPDLLSKNQSVQHTFSESGGSIGRNPLNDWVICDTNRFISGKHARISCNNGTFYITDTSTNGVFVNQDSQALGNGNSSALDNRQELQMGELRLSVELVDDVTEINSEIPLPVSEVQNTGEDLLDNLFGNLENDAFNEEIPLESSAPEPAIEDLVGDALQMEPPVDDGGVIDPLALLDNSSQDNLGQLFAVSQATDTPQSSFIDQASSLDLPLDLPKIHEQQHEPVDELDLLLRDLEAPAPTPAPVTESAAAQQADILELLGSGINPTPQATPASPAVAQTASTRADPGADSVNDSGAVDKLLQAAGLNPDQYTQAQRQAMLPLLGSMLRGSLDGLVTALMARNQVKSGLRMEVTTIAPVENNPLKFSVNGEEALRNLLSVRQGYLGPEEAIREGFQDLQIHQLAMMAATQRTLQALVARFNPASLEHSFEQQKSASIKLGSKKSLYWDQYAQFFEHMQSAISDDFMHLLGDVFADAYAEQAQRAKHTTMNTK